MRPDLQGLPALWHTIYRGRGFKLRAVAREARTAATSRAEGAVHARRGDILDFKMFSNLSLNLLVELEAVEVEGPQRTTRTVGSNFRWAPWPIVSTPSERTVTVPVLRGRSRLE